MTDMVFRTGGDWDSTTLYNNGFEVPAAQLFVELQAGRDEWGDPTDGGIREGADLTAFVRPVDNPDDPFDIFPGRLTLETPGGNLVIENRHPGVNMEYTRVWFNGEDVTERVVDIGVEITYPEVASAFVSIYKSRWFRRDELITYSLLG